MNKRIFILIVSVLLVAAISIAFVSCDKPSPEEQFYGKYIPFDGCTTISSESNQWVGFIRFENGGGWAYDEVEEITDKVVIWKPVFTPNVDSYDIAVQQEIDRFIELINKGVEHKADGLYLADGTVLKYEQKAEKKNANGKTHFWYGIGPMVLIGEPPEIAINVEMYDGINGGMDGKIYGKMKYVYINYAFRIKDSKGNIVNSSVAMMLMKEGSYVEV